METKTPNQFFNEFPEPLKSRCLSQEVETKSKFFDASTAISWGISVKDRDDEYFWAGVKRYLDKAAMILPREIEGYTFARDAFAKSK